MRPKISLLFHVEKSQLNRHQIKRIEAIARRLITFTACPCCLPARVQVVRERQRVKTWSKRKLRFSADRVEQKPSRQIRSHTLRRSICRDLVPNQLMKIDVNDSNFGQILRIKWKLLCKIHKSMPSFIVSCCCTLAAIAFCRSGVGAISAARA